MSQESARSRDRRAWPPGPSTRQAPPPPESVQTPSRRILRARALHGSPELGDRLPLTTRCAHSDVALTSRAPQHGRAPGAAPCRWRAATGSVSLAVLVAVAGSTAAGGSPQAAAFAAGYGVVFLVQTGLSLAIATAACCYRRLPSLPDLIHGRCLDTRHARLARRSAYPRRSCGVTGVSTSASGSTARRVVRPSSAGGSSASCAASRVAKALHLPRQ